MSGEGSSLPGSRTCADLDNEKRRDRLAAMKPSPELNMRVWGRLFSLPVGGAFQPRWPFLATGKWPEPAGWKACPTHSTARARIAEPARQRSFHEPPRHRRDAL